MALRLSSPEIRLSTDSPPDADTDLLVIPAFDGEAVADSVPALDQATHGELKRATASGAIKGRPYEIFVTPLEGAWKAGRVAIVGAGKPEDFTTERLRRVAAASALV